MTTINDSDFGKVRGVNYKGKTAAQKTIAGNVRGIKAIRTMEGLSDHRNIVSYYGHEYDSSRNFVIYTEPYDMDLATYIQNKGNIAMVEIKVFINEVIDAVENTHNNNIVHRYITPQNILLKKEGGIYVTKLGDFGIANDSDPGSSLDTDTITPSYMAPEVSTGDYTYIADVYSLGVLLQQLLSYCTDANKEMRRLHNLALEMTVEDPNQRISLAQVKSELNMLHGDKDTSQLKYFAVFAVTLILVLLYTAYSMS